LAARGEVLVEFVVQGNFVKVTAIETVSGTEAIIVGPANAPQSTLKAAVLQKLNYILKKQAAGG
jgi:hypothetical protein